METKVHCRARGKRAFTEATVKFFQQELNIANSTWTLEVVYKRIRKTDDMRGCVINAEMISPKLVMLFVDSTLRFEDLVCTLAHEMVHVKQMVKGQYRIEETAKGARHFWMGKQVKKDYYEQPWELEAWAKERLLAVKLYSKLEKLC
jgi:hypothetical protein